MVEIVSNPASLRAVPPVAEEIQALISGASQGQSPQTTLRGAADAYLGLLKSGDYGRNLAAVMAGSAGSAVARGGVLMALEGLGPRTPLLAFSLIEGCEQAGRSLSRVQAALARDAADRQTPLRGDAGVRADLAAQLSAWGLGGVTCSVAMLAAFIGHSKAGLPQGALVGTVAVSKAAQTFMVTREAGAFNCLKLHLGDAPQQRVQARFSRTIVAIEALPLDNLSRQIPLLLLLACGGWATAGKGGTQVPWALMGAGATLAAASKGVLYALHPSPGERPRAEEKAAEMGSPLDPAEPGLSLMRQILQDRDYACHLLPVLGAALANGVGRAGMLLVLGGVGSQSAGLPMLGAVMGAGLEQVGRSVSFLLASLRRDAADEDVRPAGDRSARREARAQLVRAGLWVVGGHAITLGCGAGLATGWLEPSAVVVGIAASKGLQAFYEANERGAFARLKRHLGGPPAQRLHSQYSRGIQDAENAVLNSLERLLPPALFWLAGHSTFTPVGLSAWGMGAAAAACVLGGAARWALWRQGQRFDGEAAGQL